MTSECSSVTERFKTADETVLQVPGIMKPCQRLSYNSGDIRRFVISGKAVRLDSSKIEMLWNAAVMKPDGLFIVQL